jgi:hypothetical protein
MKTFIFVPLDQGAIFTAAHAGSIMASLVVLLIVISTIGHLSWFSYLCSTGQFSPWPPKSTVDRAIQRLQSLKADVGGDAEVTPDDLCRAVFRSQTTVRDAEAEAAV